MLAEVGRGLKAFEREIKELNLVLFPEALAHAVRMERVLSTPGGHLLLVGSSGVGRRGGIGRSGLDAARMGGAQIIARAANRHIRVIIIQLGCCATAHSVGQNSENVNSRIAAEIARHLFIRY